MSTAEFAVPLESLLRRSADPDSTPGWQHDLLALLLAFLFFLQGNTAQLWDRDEPRYAEASRVMLASGDWVVPQFNGNIRDKKPPLIYWLQAASYAAFGVSEWSARLPATIFGALTVFLLFRFVRRRTGRLRSAWLTIASFSLCLMTMVQAGASTIDSVLLTFITLMMLEWLTLTSTRPRLPGGKPVPLPMRRTRWALWWVWMGIAIMLKFPVPIAVVGAGIALFYAFRPSELRPFIGQLWRDTMPHAVGIGLMLAIILPWAIAVQSATDGHFLNHLVGFEVLERAAQAQEGHGGPIIYYLVALPLFMAPWPLLMLFTWRHVDDGFDRRGMLWMVAWALATVVVFSVASTKLPHYVFPAFPPLAVLIGVSLDRALAVHGGVGSWRGRRADGFSRARTWLWKGLGGVCWLVTVAAIAMPVAAVVLDLGDILLPVIAVALFLGVGSFFVGRAFRGHNIRAAILHTSWSALIVCGIGAGWGGVAFNAYKPGRVVGATVRAQAPVQGPGAPLYCFQYDESSLTFYTRRTTVSLHRTFGNRGWEQAPFWEWVAQQNPGEPVVILIRREPGAADAGPPLQYAKDKIARERLKRCRQLGERVGPFFHYNQGRDRRFYLEMLVFDPPAVTD